MNQQVREVNPQGPRRYLAYVGFLVVCAVVSGLLSIVEQLFLQQQTEQQPLGDTFLAFLLEPWALPTWVVMLLLVGLSWWGTRRLSAGPRCSRWQHILELLVGTMNQQIREASQQDPKRYLPFVGTLFLFIAMSNLLSIVPGYQPPTGNLSTTTALALCVFVAVPLYGISSIGWKEYLKQYLRPTVFMLPFNIIGELSRTLALAVRLFGNAMSGTKVVGILLMLIPVLFPALMQLLGLLTGMIQAYIFALLALVYIASASSNGQPAQETTTTGDVPERNLT